MKPKVFLSHSKKDKEFIERIANDLRASGIDVWYDEWEIPPGESIRKKIFEDGITSCDLFFVYLTENSIPSYWVKRELDGAFIHEIEMKNSFMILYVNKDDNREKLSLDLKALNIPSLNSENYLTPFSKLISRTWNAYNLNQIKQSKRDNKIQTLELEKKVALLENRILKMQQSGTIDFEIIRKQLKMIQFNFNGIDKHLFEILMELKNVLADGAYYYTINKKIRSVFNDESADDNVTEGVTSKYPISDFTGELILKGLVEIKTSVDLDQSYSLTKLGRDLINDEIAKQK